MIINYTKKNLEMVRGDTLSFGIEISDDEGNLITPDTISFSCKKTYNDDEYIFQKTLNDGISLSQEKPNTYIVRVAPADTKNVDLGHYSYDLEISVNGDIFTILTGILKITYEITRGD